MAARPTNVRYVVLFGLCLAAGLAYIHRGCLSVVESTARAGHGPDGPSQTGLGPRRLLLGLRPIPDPDRPARGRLGPSPGALTLFGLLGAVTVAMGAGTLWVDAATGFALLLASRILMGIAQAGLFPASTRAMSVWIPLRRRAFAAGMLQACMSLGGAVGAFLTARLLGVVSGRGCSRCTPCRASPGAIGFSLGSAIGRTSTGGPTRPNANYFAGPTVAKASGRRLGRHLRRLIRHLRLCPAVLPGRQQRLLVHLVPDVPARTPTAWTEQEAGELTSLPIIGVVCRQHPRRTGGRPGVRPNRQPAGEPVRYGDAATIVGVVCFGLTYFVPARQTAWPSLLLDRRGRRRVLRQLVRVQRRDGPGRPQPGDRVRGHEHVRQLRGGPVSRCSRVGRSVRLAGGRPARWVVVPVRGRVLDSHRPRPAGRPGGGWLRRPAGP